MWWRLMWEVGSLRTLSPWPIPWSRAQDSPKDVKVKGPVNHKATQASRPAAGDLWASKA